VTGFRSKGTKTMTRLAATIVASVLACWSGGAFGAEMPNELRGYWCNTDANNQSSKFIRCKEENWDGMCCVIDRQGSGSEHSNCKALNVRRVDAYSWIIKERCAYGSVEEKKNPDGDDAETRTTRYIRRGVYLYINDLP
jgi:hypothetical protein